MELKQLSVGAIFFLTYLQIQRGGPFHPSASGDLDSISNRYGSFNLHLQTATDPQPATQI